MEIQLIDDRLRNILPEAEFSRLRAKTERLYSRLHKKVGTDCQRDLCELLLAMRDLETELTDRCVAADSIRQERRLEAYQGSMATLA